MSCNKIVAFIKKNQIKCEIVNLGHKQSIIEVQIVPALFENRRLLAYGSDILSHLKKLFCRVAKR